MKNLERVVGVIAMCLILVFALTACSDSSSGSDARVLSNVGASTTLKHESTLDSMSEYVVSSIKKVASGSSSFTSAYSQAYSIGTNYGTILKTKGYDVTAANCYMGMGYTLTEAENNMQTLVRNASISSMSAYGIARSGVTYQGQTIYLVVLYTIK